MSDKLVRFIIILILLLPFCGCGRKEEKKPPPGAISGKVTLLGQKEHTGALVFIEKTRLKDLTLPSGEYFIDKVPPGTYTVTAVKENYNSSSKGDIVVRPKKTTENIDFFLIPLGLPGEGVRIQEITPEPNTTLYKGEEAEFSLRVAYWFYSQPEGRLCLRLEDANTKRALVEPIWKEVELGNSLINFNKTISIPFEDIKKLKVSAALYLGKATTTDLIDSVSYPIDTRKDFIALEEIEPAPHQILKPGQPIPFRAKVNYSLLSAPRGRLICYLAQQDALGNFFPITDQQMEPISYGKEQKAAFSLPVTIKEPGEIVKLYAGIYPGDSTLASASIWSEPYQIMPLLPTVKITYPKEGDRLKEKIIEVTGTVSDRTIKEGTLKLNDIVQTIKISQGEFRQKVVLQRGNNTIEVSAENKAGVGRDKVGIFADIEIMALRVQLNWNKTGTTWSDGCDVDLHIIDPTGEECYFGHACREQDGLKTKLGGQLDLDNTIGYGPEVFTLPQAAPGKYIVRVHYYRENHNGPTEALVTITINEETTRKFGPHKLEKQGDWWTVTTLKMPQGTFE